MSHIQGLMVNRFGCRRRMGEGVRQPSTLCDSGLDDFRRMLELVSSFTAFCRRALR